MATWINLKWCNHCYDLHPEHEAGKHAHHNGRA